MPCLSDLIEELQYLEEHIAEVGAEMANEVAMFGDSWPGSQLQLSEKRQRAAELRKLIEEARVAPRFNATRDQWKKAWRNARVIASQGREPKLRIRHSANSLAWFAFTLVCDRPWHNPPIAAQLRLRWQRDDLDIPF